MSFENKAACMLSSEFSTVAQLQALLMHMHCVRVHRVYFWCAASSNRQDMVVNGRCCWELLLTVCSSLCAPIFFVSHNCCIFLAVGVALSPVAFVTVITLVELLLLQQNWLFFLCILLPLPHVALNATLHCWFFSLHLVEYLPGSDHCCH